MAWLDAVLARQGDAILACVGRPLVAVRVSASARRATWSLQGAYAGTPEEECVRAVVVEETSPPSDGVLVRAVR